MYLIPWGILAVLTVVFDFVSKKIVLSKMELYESIPVIKDVFHITYIENTGASFGIFQGARWFFVVITIIVMAAVIIFTIKNCEKNKLYLLSASFIVGGGIGNLIDRVAKGAVVDFLDFCLIDFPIFNVADCFVVVGVFLMLIYCITEEIKEKKANKNGEGDGNL